MNFRGQYRTQHLRFRGRSWAGLVPRPHPKNRESCKPITSPVKPSGATVYRIIPTMSEHKIMLQFCVYMKCMTEDVMLVERASSSEVFVHELAVEFWTDCIVDEALFLRRNRTMKDSLNTFFLIFFLCNWGGSHCSDYYTKVDKMSFQTGRLFAWTSILS